MRETLARLTGSVNNNDTDDFDDSDDCDSASLLSSPSSSLALAQALPSLRGSKRYRTQMNSTMIKVMKSIFADYKTPTMSECDALGRAIGLPKRVVQVWFQNARAKDKKARLAFTKTFGTDFESSALNNQSSIEDCKICGVKYNLKLSSNAMQEHIFSATHIAALRVNIEASSARKVNDGEEDDFPVASGHPIPATMLVNPHSTTFNPSAFPLLPVQTPETGNLLQLFQGFKH